MFRRANTLSCHKVAVLATVCLLQLSSHTYATPFKPQSTSDADTSDAITFPPPDDANLDWGNPPYSNGDPPQVVLRGDSRSPEELQQTGGMPVGYGGPFTNQSFSLETHHIGKKKVPTAYVSTTTSFSIALDYATMVSPLDFDARKDGWVYMIHATPNMIDLLGSGIKTSWPSEHEYSSMGGIRYDQIMGWLSVSADDLDPDEILNYKTYKDFQKDHPKIKWEKNKQYNKKYNAFKPSQGQPQLVGNETWPNSLGQDTPRGRPASEYPQMTLEGWAVEFMNRTAWPVGWKGAFPMDLKARGDFGGEKMSDQVPVPPR
ncbi:putative enterotoxin [Ophiocordyceps camponoti-rufipedis]|uniref:Putative enterotoxin n=1 Tax=Ophiocordyceps camponoti-rufipedis TaxID=2004952 RepID=A0A2C5ZIL8_9HYPO|nr:putative enterotoxin [Ophiocordyceps camponoti-rufipedis]